MIVTCYAEGRPGQWEAVCLDFDIAVQGASLDEVFDGIRKAVADYAAYVAGLPEAERTAFLHRRAPLWLRLRFFWRLFIATIFGRDGGADTPSRAEFALPCPT